MHYLTFFFHPGMLAEQALEYFGMESEASQHTKNYPTPEMDISSINVEELLHHAEDILQKFVQHYGLRTFTLCGDENIPCTFGDNNSDSDKLMSYCTHKHVCVHTYAHYTHNLSVHAFITHTKYTSQNAPYPSSASVMNNVPLM